MSLLDPIVEYIDKARSRIYGIFIFWLIVPHIPLIFSALFIDQSLIYQKTHLLKGEYLRTTFYGYTEWWMWALYAATVIGFAVLMTWLMIWVLPKSLIKRSYQQELDDQYEREFMKIKKEEELNDQKSILLDEQKKIIEEEEDVAKKQDNLENREETTWLKEYREFKKTNMHDNFHLIPEAIYEHYGRMVEYDDYGNEQIIFEVPTGLISYADGNGLIDVDVKDKRINLTQKGRFFLKNYQLEQKLNSNNLPF